MSAPASSAASRVSGVDRPQILTMSDIFLVFWLTRRRLYEANRYGLERCPFYIATAVLSCKPAARKPWRMA
jgi:hypothetical protein